MQAQKNKGLYEEIIIAGFGGQGVILAGKLLAQSAMRAGREVTYMPSYGAEVRGGTANCMVVIADRPVASPVISRPDTLIAMNKASLNKYAPMVKPAGLIILNSSLIDHKPDIDPSVTVIDLPADELAVELGTSKIANMVALGAYLQKTAVLSLDVARSCLSYVIAARYKQMLDVNAHAMQRGADFVGNGKYKSDR